MGVGAPGEMQIPSLRCGMTNKKVVRNDSKKGKSEKQVFTMLRVTIQTKCGGPSLRSRMTAKTSDNDVRLP